LSSPARALLPLWREAFQTSRRTSSRASVTQETTWNGSYVQRRIMRAGFERRAFWLVRRPVAVIV